MRQFKLPAAVILAINLVRTVQCLSVISGSPCYDTCNGGSQTSSNDIVCLDSDWNSQKGQILSQCMTCLRSSTFSQGPMNDEILFMYYLSTVQQTCLSGSPGQPISTCSDECDTVDSAFSGLGGRTFFQSPYSYCSANSNAYTADALNCSTCLASQDGVVTLSNFVYTGNTACEQQPDLGSDDSLDFASGLFATSALAAPSGFASSSANKTSSSSGTTTSATTSGSASANSTSSTSTTTGASTSTAATPTKTAAGSNNQDDGDKDAHGSGSQGLSRGAAAGIGIALGIVGVALIVLVAVLARRGMLAKEGNAGPFSKMRDSPEMRQAPPAPPALPAAMPLPAETERGATPPGAGVFVPPPQPKSSKSFKSSRTWKSMTPRTSEWFWAANPKQSSDLSALPQRGWD